MPENSNVSQHVIVLLWHLVQFPNVYSSELYQCMHHPQFSLHYTAVGAPTIRTVIAGLNSIFLEWSPPSEGSLLSYTVTWTGRGVTSNVVLLPTARDYTIEGLDSNTAYSGTVEVYSLPYDRYRVLECPDFTTRWAGVQEQCTYSRADIF